MNDMVDLPALPRDLAEALANGTLRDPFGVLGPHDTSAGRIVRAFLPGATEVEVSRAVIRIRSAGWRRLRHRDFLLEAPAAQNPICCA